MEDLARALKAAGPRSLADVRASLGIANRGTFDKNFKPGAAADFPTIASRIHRNIRDLGADPKWRAPCAERLPAVAKALRALEAVLLEFDIAAPAATGEPEHGPFEPIDENLAEFVRVASAVHPLPQPTFDDFRAGRIADRRGDAVFERLKEQRICYLKGTASFGKTTAAMVAAFRHMSRAYRGFHLDLGQIQDDGHDETRQAFVRLLGKGERSVILLDNAHRQPALVRRLRREWDAIHPQSERPLLLVVGTTIAYSAATAAEHCMAWPEGTIEVALGPENFADIAAFYLRRAGNSLVAPGEALEMWARQFGNHLHAFCFALLRKVRTLGEGGQLESWRLERADALSWIRENWLMRRVRGRLDDVDPLERENLFCLSSFAEQDLELSVDAEALPQRAHAPFAFYRDLGVIAERTRPYRGAEVVTYGLMEHGWGALILEAADVSAQRALEFQAEAIERLPRLGLSVLSRYEVTSPQKGEALIDQIDRDGWSDITGRSSIATLAGLTAAVVQPRPEALARLRDAIVVRAASDMPLIAEADFSQLCYLVELLRPLEGKSGLAAGLIRAIENHAPPDDCRLYRTAGQSVRGNQLRWMSQLDPSSPLRAGLAAAIGPALEASLDTELASRKLESVTDLLDGVHRGLPESFDALLDALLDDARKAKLGTLIDIAVPYHFHHVLAFDRGKHLRDPRIARLFFEPLRGCDWASRIHPGVGGAKGAIHLARALADAGLVDEAADLGDIVVRRADYRDLGWVNSVSQIWVIATACRLCRSPEDASRYFERMHRVVMANLTNEAITKSKMAAELGALAQCDAIDLNVPELENAARLRAFHRFGLPPGQPLDEAGAAEYVRLVGSLASCWRLGLFRHRLGAFLDEVGIEGVLANPAMWPRDDLDESYVPVHQIQFWQGLWALSFTSGQDLPVDRHKLRALRDRWEGNLAFAARSPIASTRAANRTRTIVSWIDASLAAGASCLIPATGSMRHPPG